jgi:hypothetical protein
MTTTKDIKKRLDTINLKIGDITQETTDEEIEEIERELSQLSAEFNLYLRARYGRLTDR